MKCPIMKDWHQTDSGGFYYEHVQCIQERCNWWDEKNGECDFKVARRNLGLIALALSEIVNKMSSGQPFVK